LNAGWAAAAARFADVFSTAVRDAGLPAANAFTTAVRDARLRAAGAFTTTVRDARLRAAGAFTTAVRDSGLRAADAITVAARGLVLRVEPADLEAVFFAVLLTVCFTTALRGVYAKVFFAVISFLIGIV